MPLKMRHFIHGHEVVTVAYMGWAGVKNGELLKIAEAAGIDVLVTADGSLSYQQNLTGRHIAIVALSDNHWFVLKENLEEIAATVDAAEPGSFKFLKLKR